MLMVNGTGPLSVVTGVRLIAWRTCSARAIESAPAYWLRITRNSSPPGTRAAHASMRRDPSGWEQHHAAGSQDEGSSRRQLAHLDQDQSFTDDTRTPIKAELCG
jgi:hypothetical protein